MKRYDFVNDHMAIHLAKAHAHTIVQKKPVSHLSFVLDEPVEFVTPSGTQQGNIGDIVIVAKDHAWPVSKEYFEENYVTIAHDGVNTNV